LIVHNHSGYFWTNRILVLLFFVHVVAEWVFKTRFEQQHKYISFWARFKRSTVYTAIFAGVFYLLGVPLVPVMAVFAGWLWFTHMIIDTGFITFLWAKYVYHMPELRKVHFGQKGKIQRAYSTPDAMISVVIFNQMLHMLCLVPIVILFIVPWPAFLIF